MDQVSSITRAINELMDSAAIAHPTETIKCKLQLQLVQTGALSRQFAGPIDVIRQTVNGQGITGMWNRDIQQDVQEMGRDELGDVARYG
jgi:hypothetical protein